MPSPAMIFSGDTPDPVRDSTAIEKRENHRDGCRQRCSLRQTNTEAAQEKTATASPAFAIPIRTCEKRVLVIAIASPLVSFLVLPSGRALDRRLTGSR